MYPTVKLFLAGGRIDTIHSAVSYCDHCEHHLGHGIYYVCCNAADMWAMFDNVRNEEYKTQRSAFSWWHVILLPMILRLGATPALTPIFRLRAALRVHIWHSSYIWCWKRAPLSVNMGPPSKMGTGLPMVRTARIFWTSVPSCLSLINSVFITSHTTCMSGVLHVLRGLYQWITIQRRDIVASDKICPAHATTSTHAHWQPSTRDFVLEYVVFMCLPFWTDKVCLMFIV